MDSHYSYGPAYAPTQPPDSRQSFNPLCSSQSLAANPIFTPTLPPLSNSYFQFSQGQSAQGAGSSQSAYIPAITTANDQSSSYSSYHGSQHSTYQQTPRSFQPPQAYQPSGHNPHTYRPYSAAPTTQQNRLAELRPMPFGGSNELQSTATTPGLSGRHSFSHHGVCTEAEPTHVVGSQGRRGILPSANGRPIAVANTNTSKSSTAGLKKDPNDNKWPCDHCNKRYLHAKHLKRHLLRHTGTRPYACGLCKDTFSRSDILKRHFAKCSLRRGNPTGANHLTHSRATRKSGNDSDGPMRQVGTRNHPNQISDPTEYSLGAFSNIPELNTTEAGQSNFSEGQQSHSNQLSRASSVKGISKSTPTSARGTLTAPNSAGFDGSAFPYSGGQATPDSLTTSGAATPFNYPSDLRSHQLSPNTSITHSMGGLDLSSIGRITGSTYSNGTIPEIVDNSHDRSNGMDWPAHHTEEHENYSENQYQHPHMQPAIKTEVNYPSGSFSLSQQYPPFHVSTQ